MKTVSRWLLLTSVLGASGAWACAVCGQAVDQANGPFIYMSVIMSVLPLFAIGGVVAFVAVHLKRDALAQAEERARASSLASQGPVGADVSPS